MSIAEIKTGDKVAIVGSWKAMTVKVTKKYIVAPDGRKFHRDTGDEAKKNWTSIRDRITPIEGDVIAKVSEADAQRTADKSECVEGSFLFLVGKPLSECTTPMQKRGWAMAQVEQRKKLRFQKSTGEYQHD